jgi:hypothetical protein
VKRNSFYYCDGITEDRIEEGDAIQITGERGNFEAIKFFLSMRRYSSRLNIKESKIKSEGFEQKPLSLKITQSELLILFFTSFISLLFSKKE